MFFHNLLVSVDFSILYSMGKNNTTGDFLSKFHKIFGVSQKGQRF